MPLAMNVSIETDTRIEVFPFLSPDLFAGAPLMLCGTSDKKISADKFFFKAQDISGNMTMMPLMEETKMTDFPVEFITA